MGFQSEVTKSAWSMRADGLRRRSPSWIPQSFWAPLLLLPLPALLEGFSEAAILRAALAGTCYVFYSACAFVYWRERHRNGTCLQDTGTVLVVLGYDGLGLFFLSQVSLAASLLTMQRIPDLQRSASLIILALYTALVAVVALRGKSILGYISRRLDRPLAPEMRWMLGLPSLIIGAGVVAAAVLRVFDTGWLLTAGASALAALLLAPFAALTLYQIPLFLLWREKPGSPS